MADTQHQKWLQHTANPKISHHAQQQQQYNGLVQTEPQAAPRPTPSNSEESTSSEL
jgi:hypothetical protein